MKWAARAGPVDLKPGSHVMAMRFPSSLLLVSARTPHPPATLSLSSWPFGIPASLTICPQHPKGLRKLCCEGGEHGSWGTTGLLSLSLNSL